MGVLFRYGLLNLQQQEWIQTLIDAHPHAVLLKDNLSQEWMNANLSGHELGMLQMGEHPIYFFKDKADYDKVCALQEQVVDPTPFVTFPPDSILSKVFRL
jgi:hypothetical protein